MVYTIYKRAGGVRLGGGGAEEGVDCDGDDEGSLLHSGNSRDM